MLNRSITITRFVIVLSVLNLILFHFPFFSYVLHNFNASKINKVSFVISLVVLMLAANAFTYYLVFFLSRILGKFLVSLCFVASAIAVYFVNTYGVIIDESMIGNVLNTHYEEASSFFSIKLILYIIILGIVPTIYVARVQIVNVTWRRFLITLVSTLLFILLIAFANAKNWLWVDKNSKQLGGLAMPWSYCVNTSLFYIHKQQQNEKEILLPNATIKDKEKTVFVLVIGESARSQNFSLYGYNRNTNPLLSQERNVFSYKATSCATYTTAGVKCILEHKSSGDLYEILPNYLYRNDVDVIWRTTNWGEPPVHISTYQNADSLIKNCKGDGCNYDEVLLSGLQDQIRASKKDKILIILHTSTSHGPTYSKKYPPRFERFAPVCNSVELSNCSATELINAYDNTIVYTDYILHNIIDSLTQLKDYKSAMLFVSDHGESLGEKNLYMHGVPISFAPKEQYEIPFIVWKSENSTRELISPITLTQQYVFHSVLDFLGVSSPVYDKKMSIFK
jgi:lipid A ethanolaminephosphotransferase